MPGSTMSQLEFIDELCRRCDVGLLLDLAHFYITSKTLNFDPVDELEHFPLSRVVEVHISGVDEQQGMHWDGCLSEPSPWSTTGRARSLTRRCSTNSAESRTFSDRGASRLADPTRPFRR
jgi:hypothetical protein